MCQVRIMFAATLLLACSGVAQQQTSATPSVSRPDAPAATDRGAGAKSSAAFHFRVRVLDGRNGIPIRNAHVTLWYDEPAGPGYSIATDAHGNVKMPAPAGEPVRVLVSIVDYTDCRKPLRDDPPKGYSLTEIAHSGFAGENRCGPVTVHPQPGDLVLFARAQRWYEGLNRGSSY